MSQSYQNQIYLYFRNILILFFMIQNCTLMCLGKYHKIYTNSKQIPDIIIFLFIK